jgi:hypothetical protein
MAIVCALLALVAQLEVLRLLFAAPLAFVLPGYAVLAAIFVRKRPALALLLTLTIGLSLSILVLGGLVLHFVPGALRGFDWAFLLAIVTVGACRLAALRRPAAGKRMALTWPRLNKAQTGLYAAAALTAVAALALAFATLPAKQAIGYTELWIQPYGADGGGVRVGVGSDEQHRTVYGLHVRFGEGDGEVVRRFALGPGQSRVLRFPSVRPSMGSQRVAAVLFRAGRPNQPYRRVAAWTPADLAPR